jgi:hypothetical protein
LAEKTFDLEFVKIWRDPGGVICLRYTQGAVVTVNEVKQTAAAMNELSEGIKRPVFVDARGLVNVNREARIYSLSDESSTRWILALGTLITPVVQVLGNLFTAINKPPYPVKYFTAEDEAMKWLKGFL